jgi:DNA replication protein DnaC
VADPATGIPLRFQTCSFDNFDLSRNPLMGRALTACRQLLDGARAFVFLSGGTGLGKTHLLAATVMEWRRQGAPSWFWETPELMAHLRGTFERHKRDPESPDLDVEVKSLSGSGVLLGLDDFGTQNETPWVNETLYRILNARYTAMAPTIVTSNVSPGEIDERIRSRFREGLIACEGRDVRG